jgi:hypothetical protein
MKAAHPRPMVDPATPEAAKTTHGKDPTEDMFLVFSDEFETPGRSFKHGSDPYWTAIDHYNPTTSDLEYYTSDLVTTKAVPSGGGTTGAMVITATHDGREGHEYSAGTLLSPPPPFSPFLPIPGLPCPFLTVTAVWHAQGWSPAGISSASPAASWRSNYGSPAPPRAPACGPRRG